MPLQPKPNKVLQRIGSCCGVKMLSSARLRCHSILSHGIRFGSFLEPFPIASRWYFNMNVCEYHQQKRCFHATCDLIDFMGNVSVCPLHPNPSGFLMRREVGANG